MENPSRRLPCQVNRRPSLALFHLSRLSCDPINRSILRSLFAEPMTSLLLQHAGAEDTIEDLTFERHEILGVITDGSIGGSALPVDPEPIVPACRFVAPVYEVFQPFSSRTIFCLSCRKSCPSRSKSPSIALPSRIKNRTDKSIKASCLR